MSEPVKTRSYDSTRRLAQAADTRCDIMRAAKGLFERDGYAATTIPAVAHEAGVAQKTVYTGFGSKGGLLHGVWDLALGGDDSQTPVAARAWYQEVLDEPDPRRQLLLNARNSRAGKERIGRLLEVIRAATGVDPAVADLWRTIQVEFHANQRVIVASLHGKGALKRGLGVTRGTDILWMLNHPNTWQLLVGERGWTPAQYERWFGDAAVAQLLA